MNSKTKNEDNGDGGTTFIEKDQFNFWGIGGNNDDPWDTLHAHFEKLSRTDGRYVEESTTTGKGSPAK